MKLKSIFSFLLSVAICLFAGTAVAQVVPAINPVMAGVVFFATKTIYIFVLPNGKHIQNVFMSGLNREIWIDELRQNFYALDQNGGPDPLEGCADWTEWVEYNTIDFASVGVDPVILVNNATWPIVAVQRTDNALQVALATYDSTTTRVRNVEEIESQYNKLESVVFQHKKQLRQVIVDTGLVAYAPTSNATATPVIQTTGSTRTITMAGGILTTAGNQLTIADIASLQERFDILNYPAERRLLLNPAHRRDLMMADSVLFKNFTDLPAGKCIDLFGFEVMPYNNTPIFTKSTYAKKAYGAAVDLTNDVPASTAFCPGECMKALGDTEVFLKDKTINPEQRAWEVGYQQRAIVLPIRGQVCIGAIVTARA